MDLKKFQDSIRNRFHLDFKPDFFRFLGDAIEARIRATGIDGMDNYWSHFENDPEEISHLVNLLTNKETYFFRENPHYRLLTQRLIPELLKNRSFFGEPIKIISAGCSSGEEPYSLVLALVDMFGEGVTDQIEVIGLDIDDEVLHKASMAVFGAYSFRGVDPELRSANFDQFAGNRFVLKSSIRQCVKFIQHNLADWPYPEEARGADLIFYRNVSIYYQPDTQNAIFGNLTRLLVPEGYLLTGAVEVPHHDTGRLALLKDEDIFYFSKETEESELPAFMENPITSPPSTEKEDKAPSQITRPETREGNSMSGEEITLEEVLSLAKEEQWELALNKVDEQVNKNPDCLPAYSCKAYLLLQLNRDQETERVCQQALEKNSLFLAPYLLLGLASQKNTDHKEAVHRLRKAVYLDPSCWLAHFHLADSYRETGDTQAARREYGVTLKLLESAGLENHGLPFFKSHYTADQMSGICREQMNKLTLH